MTAQRGVLKHSGLRVLVTGGRDYADWEHVFRSLDRVHRKHGVLCIISGHCMDREGNVRGADRWSEEWATANRIPVVPFPVTNGEWKAIGNSAGPLRNRRMVDEATPDICVRFPGNRGTADCASYAHERGVLVWDALTNKVS